MRRIVIAGTSSHCGKTTLTCGLLEALLKRGYVVSAYKTGPDYIDPQFLRRSGKCEAYNLDTWLMTEQRTRELFAKTAHSTGIAVIEGAMGLYDGGVHSTASISKLVNAPVILVVDAKSLGESAAAVALGFREYDRDVNFAGVILNRTGSEYHAGLIADALERVGIKCFGAVKRDEGLGVAERHLGLVPADEGAGYDSERLRLAVEEGVNLDEVLRVSESVGDFSVHPIREEGVSQKTGGITHYICDGQPAQSTGSTIHPIHEEATTQKTAGITQTIRDGQPAQNFGSTIYPTHEEATTQKTGGITQTIRDGQPAQSTGSTIHPIHEEATTQKTAGITHYICDGQTAQSTGSTIYPIREEGVPQKTAGITQSSDWQSALSPDSTTHPSHGTLYSLSPDSSAHETLHSLHPDSSTHETLHSLITPHKCIRIGVARDEAFSFYYPESLCILEELGAELEYFSPIHDPELPKADGYIFGGGFPEMFAGELAANGSMLESVRANTRPVLAECGGYMYLCRSLRDFDGRVYGMAGVIPAEAVMTEKPTLGYMEGRALRKNILCEEGAVIRGHEFHYSRMEADFPETLCAFSLTRRNASTSHFGNSTGRNTNASLFGNSTGQNTNTSLFGNSTGQNTNASLFGNSTSQNTNASLFGDCTGRNTNASLFGNSTGQNTNASLFGNCTGQNTNTSLFGNSTGQNTNASLFGNSTSQNTNASLFGNSTGQNTNTSLFGNSTSQNTNASLFGNCSGQNASTSHFGGYAHKNILASYLHINLFGNPELAERFIVFLTLTSV